ncbi:SsgA family sporulation/cell division regulator [Streptomyces sp. NPDC097619]|uniref:SsgA family sporulation/cell division regulator n=1 Tax=Streptomyces sp. NPDC097619 TaxID=3157228 RepID=UPI00332D22A7
MSCVSAEIDVRLTAEDQPSVPLRLRLTYASTDPYAVQAEFRHEGATLACWYFDREALAAGLRAPGGGGDVRFRPAATRRGPALRIELRGRIADDPGTAVFLADAVALARFLSGTHALVPPGTEVLDIDALLDALLAN